MKPILFYLLLSAVLTACSARDSHQSVKDEDGTGWQCDEGYSQAGLRCVPIALPDNASYDRDATQGWSCNLGYYRAGHKCTKRYIPTNASAADNNRGWICDHGYIRAGTKCVVQYVPEGAHIIQDPKD